MNGKQHVHLAASPDENYLRYFRDGKNRFCTNFLIDVAARAKFRGKFILISRFSFSTNLLTRKSDSFAKNNPTNAFWTRWRRQRSLISEILRCVFYRKEKKIYSSFERNVFVLNALGKRLFNETKFVSNWIFSPLWAIFENKSRSGAKSGLSFGVIWKEEKSESRPFVGEENKSSRYFN